MMGVGISVQRLGDNEKDGMANLGSLETILAIQFGIFVDGGRLKYFVRSNVGLQFQWCLSRRHRGCFDS